jgi:hypothetical protein
MSEHHRFNPYLGWMIGLCVTFAVAGFISLGVGIHISTTPGFLTDEHGDGTGGILAGILMLNLSGTALFAAIIIGGATWKPGKDLIRSNDDLREAHDSILDEVIDAE